jgi:dolichol-phosphate mannosyltransferase
LASSTSARLGPSRFLTAQFVRFGLVGLSGIIVNQLLFSALVDLAGSPYALAAIVATQGSSIWNFYWVERWVFDAGDGSQAASRRFLSFILVNNLTLLARIPALWLLIDTLGASAFWSNLATLGGLFMFRFLIARNMIWSEPTLTDAALDPATAYPLDGAGTPSKRAWPARPHQPGPRPLRAKTYRYDIAGILAVESAVQLRELGFFRTDDLAEPDLRIVINRTGSLPTLRTRFVAEGDRLHYREQLGAAGANFRIQMGSPVVISVNRLLARSPHVLYTNIIEAFLRFLLVSKGYVLLHSASLAAGEHAVLLSALTDTGKTSTVIRLVRERGYRFLSDDMTIISADGRAISYPKPMTLSYHTMSAIAGQDLTRRQRAALAIQSRLHSKTGRSVGQRLGRFNIPIMSINSVVQWLVPPPKYHINSLFDCEVGGEAPIRHVFLLERGEAFREEISAEDAIDQLIDNTDDAYGFPPFATFAPHLRIGGDDYPTLRRTEREILAASLTDARIWRLRVPGHEWAEVLPGLIEARSRKNRLVALPIEAAVEDDSRTDAGAVAKEVV